jgi:hypothetical protein
MFWPAKILVIGLMLFASTIGASAEVLPIIKDLSGLTRPQSKITMGAFEPASAAPAPPQGLTITITK